MKRLELFYFEMKVKGYAKKKDEANRMPLKSYSKEASKSRSKPSNPDKKRSRDDKSKETGHQGKRAKISDSVVLSRSKDASHKLRAKASDSVVLSESKDAGHNSKRAKSSTTVTSSNSRRDPFVHTKSASKHKDLKRANSVRFDQTAIRPKIDIFSNSVTNTKSRVPSRSSSSTSEGCVSSRRRKKSSVSVGGKSKATILAMDSYDDDMGFM